MNIPYSWLKAKHPWLTAILFYKVHILPVLILLIILNQWQALASQRHETRELQQELLAEQQAQHKLVSDIFGTAHPRVKAIQVVVTSYNPVKAQCDATPFEVRDGSLVTPGVLAVSQDLLKRYHLHLGQRVILKTYGTFTIRDTMNKRHTNRVDIVSFIPGWSAKFGVRKTTLYYAKGV